MAYAAIELTRTEPEAIIGRWIEQSTRCQVIGRFNWIDDGVAVSVRPMRQGELQHIGQFELTMEYKPVRGTETQDEA